MISNLNKGFVKWIEDTVMSFTPYEIALVLLFTCDDEEIETKICEIIEKSINSEYEYRWVIPLKDLKGDKHD